MSNEYSAADRKFNKYKYSNKVDAKKSLCNYIKQLKIHFELSEKELKEILNDISKNKNTKKIGGKYGKEDKNLVK